MRQPNSGFSATSSVSLLLVTATVEKHSPSRLPRPWKTMAPTAVQMPLISRVLLLLALTSPPLYGQAATGSPPGDPTAKSGTQQAQGTSPEQNQSQPSNQPQRPSPPPQDQNSGQATPDSQPGKISGRVTD